MKIIIRNAKEPKVQTKEIRQAAEFYTNKLLTKRQAKNVELTIRICDTGDDKGYIEWLDRPVNPRKFKICISSNFKAKETLKSLAHEMSHLKQYVLGELTDFTSRSLSRWKKEEIVEDSLDYYDYPWEIDAFGRETGLYIRYKHWVQSLKS